MPTLWTGNRDYENLHNEDKTNLNKYCFNYTNFVWVMKCVMSSK